MVDVTFGIRLFVLPVRVLVATPVVVMFKSPVVTIGVPLFGISDNVTGICIADDSAVCASRIFASSTDPGTWIDDRNFTNAT